MAGCVCLLSDTEQQKTQLKGLSRKGNTFIHRRRSPAIKQASGCPPYQQGPYFFESLLCNPQWCLHLEAGSSPPGHKVAARNNWSISRKRKDSTECHSNHSSRLCTQALVMCSLLNQILAREKALPLHYSSGAGRARFPSDTWLHSGQESLKPNQGSIGGRKRAAEQPMSSVLNLEFSLNKSMKWLH